MCAFSLKNIIGDTSVQELLNNPKKAREVASRAINSGFNELESKRPDLAKGHVCCTVPITGRSHVVACSEDEEKALGVEAFDEEKGCYRTISDTHYSKVLESCANGLIAAATEVQYDWAFALFDSRTQNAFCCPGGKIGVYLGLMEIMRNEAELAAVVAHEIAHALARHYAEKAALRKAVSIGSEELHNRGNEGSARLLSGAGGKLGIMLPFSRSMEYEADEIGMILMARAGYNPAAAIEFWERFGSNRHTSTLNGILSTHPRDDDRLNAMKKVLPTAMKIYETAAEKRYYGATL